MLIDVRPPWRAVDLEQPGDPGALGRRLVLACPADAGPGADPDAEPAPTLVAVLYVLPPVAASGSELLDDLRSKGIAAQLGDLNGVRIICFVHRDVAGPRGSILHVSYLLPLEEALILLACSAMSGSEDRHTVARCARLISSVRIEHVAPSNSSLR